MKLLQEREKTHGDYKITAYTLHDLWDVIDKSNVHGLPAVEIVTLKLFALKMARILSGDSRFVDHWDDIAGYATLVADILRRDKGSGKDFDPTRLPGNVMPDGRAGNSDSGTAGGSRTRASDAF
jgi:hypothetical protein